MPGSKVTETSAAWALSAVALAITKARVVALRVRLIASSSCLVERPQRTGDVSAGLLARRYGSEPLCRDLSATVCPPAGTTQRTGPARQAVWRAAPVPPAKVPSGAG